MAAGSPPTCPYLLGDTPCGKLWPRCSLVSETCEFEQNVSGSQSNSWRPPETLPLLVTSPYFRLGVRSPRRWKDGCFKIATARVGSLDCGAGQGGNLHEAAMRERRQHAHCRGRRSQLSSTETSWELGAGWSFEENSFEGRGPASSPKTLSEGGRGDFHTEGPHGALDMCPLQLGGVPVSPWRQVWDRSPTHS